MVQIPDNSLWLSSFRILERDNSSFPHPHSSALESHEARIVKKLERIEMAQLAVSSILFKSLLLRLPLHLQSSFHDSVPKSTSVESTARSGKGCHEV